MGPPCWLGQLGWGVAVWGGAAQPSQDTHIVGGPPGLEEQEPLEPGGQLLLEVPGQGLHLLVLLLVQQGLHRVQVLPATEHQGPLLAPPSPSPTWAQRQPPLACPQSQWSKGGARPVGPPHEHKPHCIRQLLL